MAFLAAFAANIAKWLLEKGAVIFYAIAGFEWSKFWSHRKTKDAQKKIDEAKTEDEWKKGAEEKIDNF